MTNISLLVVWVRVALQVLSVIILFFLPTLILPAYAESKITFVETLSNDIDVIPFEQVVELEWHDAGGVPKPSRVISPLSPVVVRQCDPNAPKYQEALGYVFLLNSPKFAGITRMDDDRLVLTFTAAMPDGRKGFILFSDDDGLSWTQPKRTPMSRGTPVNLGDKRLMIWRNEELWFSENGGQTWDRPVRVPRQKVGKQHH